MYNVSAIFIEDLNNMIGHGGKLAKPFSDKLFLM
jgi:hypothetical protein